PLFSRPSTHPAGVMRGLPAPPAPLQSRHRVLDLLYVLRVRGELLIAPELDAGAVEILAVAQQQAELAVRRGAAGVQLDRFPESVLGLAAEPPGLLRALAGGLGEAETSPEDVGLGVRGHPL